MQYNLNFCFILQCHQFVLSLVRSKKLLKNYKKIAYYQAKEHKESSDMRRTYSQMHRADKYPEHS